MIHKTTDTKPDPQTDIPDFHIDYNGAWFHDGAPMTRKALAKLFADRALMMDEDGGYWLKTPYEQYPVQVDDVPFLIVDYKYKGQNIDLITNMDEKIPLGPDHTFDLRPEPLRGDIVPYIHVRGGLYARLSRTVFTSLANQAIDNNNVFIQSRGMDHKLAEPEEGAVS